MNNLKTFTILSIMMLTGLVSCGTTSTQSKKNCDGVYRDGKCMNQTYYHYKQFPQMYRDMRR